MSIILNENILLEDAKQFLESYKEKYSRERVFDYVHKLFCEYINSSAEDGDACGLVTIDELARNLYMFLANWGMMRKSFLMFNNYKCLIQVCKIVCGKAGKKDYTWLLDVNPSAEGLKERDKSPDDYVNDVLSLTKDIKASFKHDELCPYPGCRSFGVSDTLASKIMLVSLGCVPAYDSHLKKALENLGYPGSMTLDGIKGIQQFVQDYPHLKNVIKEAEEFRINGCSGDSDVKYSIMKYIDMILWTHVF